VVTKLDRLARSLPDARAIAEELTVRQVRLSLGGSVYDPHDPVGRLLFNVLAMVAEFEADLIRLRTREGMRVAKAKGKLRGKQPKLNPRQEAHLVALFRQGENSTAELADLFGVARSTVYRALERDRARGQTNPQRAAAMSASMSGRAQPPARAGVVPQAQPATAHFGGLDGPAQDVPSGIRPRDAWGLPAVRRRAPRGHGRCV
jgi:DNA-binding CsgD family transcriptional regulator